MAMIIIMEKQIPWICPLLFPLKATYYEIKKKLKQKTKFQWCWVSLWFSFFVRFVFRDGKQKLRYINPKRYIYKTPINQILPAAKKSFF